MLLSPLMGLGMPIASSTASLSEGLVKGKKKHACSSDASEYRTTATAGPNKGSHRVMLGLSSPTNPRLSNLLRWVAVGRDPGGIIKTRSKLAVLRVFIYISKLADSTSFHVEAGFEAGLIPSIFGILLVKASKLSLTASSWPWSHGRQAPRMQVRMSNNFPNACIPPYRIRSHAQCWFSFGLN